MKKLSIFLAALVCCILLYACERQTVPVANNVTESDFPEPETETLTTDELPILFVLNGLYGYLDRQFRVIIPPIYHHGIDYNSQGYTMVRYRGVLNEWESMVLNWKGKVVFHVNTANFEIIYDDIICYEPEGERLRRVERFRDGTVIADRIGSDAEATEDGIILVRFFDGGERAFIDSSGKRILPDLKMRMISETFREGRAVITNDNWDILVIDINGRSYGDLSFFRTNRYFSEGLLPAETNERVTGYINREGEFAFTVPIVADSPDYQLSPLNATDFKDGYALIQTSLAPPVWRVINNQGEYVSGELSVFSAYAFADGLSRIRTNGTIDSKYGYINTEGETVIAPVFDSAESFVRGYARIVYQGRDGLINTDGEIYWSDEFVKAQ